jgi:NADH dehydrogenase
MTDVVTGAFSYSGAAIARELLAAGHQVRTLTGHPERAPADTSVETRPLDFMKFGELVSSLEGTDTLYNTYWVRFSHGATSYQTGAANSMILFEAAAKAGVRRIVHVSITHASPDSPYPYFRGKAEVEQALRTSELPYAILRPAILFGERGVLINNIAWLLRRMPVFAMGGHGDYRVRCIHVDDLAKLCVSLGRREDTVTVDAVGPQALTFADLVRTIRTAVGSRSIIVPVPGAMIPVLARGLGLVLRDTLLTTEEYQAMAAGLADSDEPATGEIVLTEWIEKHAQELGRKYANELDRHFKPA